jgi:acetolactate synthase-1/2/3 large subunit
LKVAEAVAKFLESQHIKHIFGVNGGANLHLIHGVYETTNIKFIPTASELGAAYAADGYARIAGLGCAMATSGPGATNLITGIATSYYDSVPVIYITGNVASFRFGAKYGVRQYGFQETPIVDMVKDITKYAVQIDNPDRVLRELASAVVIARSGRQGPVLIDIPDDVQRMECDWVEHDITLDRMVQPNDAHIGTLKRWIERAERPVFLWGAGVRRHAAEARNLAEHLQIPVACTWGAIDLMPSANRLALGAQGTHGVRAANFAVQNADLLITLGTRIDTKVTGDPKTFLRGGKLAMCDIDWPEIGKMRDVGRQVDLPVHGDVGTVIEALREMPACQSPIDWLKRCEAWKARYKPFHPVIEDWQKSAKHVPIIVSDTGTCIGLIAQNWRWDGRQRLLHAWNMTPMGWSIPAAIGASLASGEEVSCFVGDGAAMMTLPEVVVSARHYVDVNYYLLNNQGHAMCQQTEQQWFGGRHCSTDFASGLAFPLDWTEVLDGLFGADWTGEIYNIQASDCWLKPQAKYGQPIEDADPQLPWDEFCEQMIVEPLERT